MKNLIFAFMFPVLAFGQNTDCLRDSLTETGLYSPREVAEMVGDTFTANIVSGFTFDEGFFCNTYITDTTQVELCSNGDIRIERGTTSPDKSIRSSSGIIFSSNTFSATSLTTLKDTTGFLFTVLQEQNKRFYTELDELRTKVWIYENYFGKIKGKPFNAGDCIEIEPPINKLPPCKPVNVKPKNLKKKI